MTRAIPDEAIEIVSKWEGCKLTAYQDIVGVWTVGYGSTGKHVFQGLKISKAQARELLRDDLRIAAERVAKRIGPVIDELTDAQYAALLSFTFNLGGGDPKKPEWAIWKVVRARKFDEVPAQLMRFVNAGGKRVQGLVNRRTDEVKLWNSDAYDEEIPSSVTRVVETPPTPTDTKPLLLSKSFITTAATGVASASVAVQQVTENISPMASQSELIGKVVSSLAVMAAVLTVITMVLLWLKKKNS